MERLARKRCTPTRRGTPPLAGEALAALVTELGNDWQVVAGRLTRTYRFPDFAAALAFVNRVGEMAEEQDHHPDIHLAWGMVRIEVWTHSIDGLAEGDFVFAARTELLARAAATS
jgi:4a-hydroxytetrahydrobiopterin dehydratase